MLDAVPSEPPRGSPSKSCSVTRSFTEKRRCSSLHLVLFSSLGCCAGHCVAAPASGGIHGGGGVFRRQLAARSS